MNDDRNALLDLRGIYSTLRRRAIPILAATAIAFVGVYFLSSQRTEVYSANAEVQFAAAPRLATDPDRKFKKGEISLGNEIYRIGSPTVRSAVNAELGPEAAGLIRKVGVVQVTDTDVLRISVSSTSPTVARDAAQAFADNYIELRQGELRQQYNAAVQDLRGQAREVEKDIAALQEEIDSTPESNARTRLESERNGLNVFAADLSREARLLTLEGTDVGSSLDVVKEAGLPTLPDSPTPLRDAGLAAIVVLLLGVGLAFLWEQVDTRLKTSRQVDAATGGVPMLAAVPLVNASKLPFVNRRQRVRRLVDPTSPAAEAYRTLATSPASPTCGGRSAGSWSPAA
jgi:capsular polysaccharide biosynthesis protein